MDILFFAAIAIFIFFKLREQLGKVDEEQKRDSIRNFIKEQAKTSNPNQPNLVAIPGVGIVENNPAQPIDEKSQKILDNLDPLLKANLQATLQKANLSPAHFLEGAKSAFEIILSAFSIGDLTTLKTLLSEKIFVQFKAAIEERKSQNHLLNTKIIAIDQAQIVAAQTEQNFASITINFKSQQINYITDNKEQIILGSKTEISTVNDRWTFKKDCNSPNPNWLLVATS